MLHLIDGPELRTHYWEDREVKKPSAWWDSNPWPLCYEAQEHFFAQFSPYRPLAWSSFWPLGPKIWRNPSAAGTSAWPRPSDVPAARSTRWRPRPTPSWPRSSQFFSYGAKTLTKCFFFSLHIWSNDSRRNSSSNKKPWTSVSSGKAAEKIHRRPNRVCYNNFKFLLGGKMDRCFFKSEKFSLESCNGLWFIKNFSNLSLWLIKKRRGKAFQK